MPSDDGTARGPRQRILPRVAIVGRTNVGKSTLFNRLTRARNAIVHPTPGVTRDRIHGEVLWQDRAFELIDTGGVEQDGISDIDQGIRRQIELAIDGKILSYCFGR